MRPRDLSNFTSTGALEFQAAGFTPRNQLNPYSRAHPLTLSFETGTDGECTIQIWPPCPFRCQGLRLTAAPGAVLLSVTAGMQECLIGPGIPASVFSFSPTPASASVLTCTLCGAPLELDPGAPVCVCAYCRAPSIVTFPSEQAPEFVRHFCKGIPTTSPGVCLQLRLRGVSDGLFWGLGIR